MRERLEERVDKLAGILERMRLDEYLDHVSNRRRLAWNTVLFGMLRGLGFAIGFTVLGAALMVILSRLAVNNIPVIGEFLADVLAEARARR